MARDDETVDESPSIQAIFGVLEDADCRAILRKTREPRTASELVDACDIANSTVYRKPERLYRASLLRRVDTIGANGEPVTRYERHFDELSISVDADDEFSVAIQRPSEQSNHRLAGLLSASTDEL
jgi:predicted transcriptional regulator